MNYGPSNFLAFVKQLVTGGGRMLDGVTAREDSGFLKDVNDLLGDGILPASVTYIADTNGYPVLNAAASITAVTTVPIMIPRDYDEATDSFNFYIVAHMAGATDTPTITIDPDSQVIGSASVQMAVPTGGSLTTAALSTTATKYSIDLRGNGLKRDQLVKVTITSGAHTTDALQVLAIGYDYRSTLVSYHESSGTRDGKDPVFLR